MWEFIVDAILGAMFADDLHEWWKDRRKGKGGGKAAKRKRKRS